MQYINRVHIIYSLTLIWIDFYIFFFASCHEEPHPIHGGPFPIGPSLGCLWPGLDQK